MQNKKIFFLLINFFLSVSLLGQYQSMPGTFIVTYADTQYSGTSHNVSSGQSNSYRGATIVTDYIGAWSPDEIAAFEYATGIWEQQLESTEIIHVSAEFKNLGGNALAQAKSENIHVNFNSVEPRLDHVYYSDALADKLAHKNLRPRMMKLSYR